MTPRANFNALLNGTKQPRTQEKGLPYFRIIEKTVSLCTGCGHGKHTGLCGSPDTFTGYPCVCRRTA